MSILRAEHVTKRFGTLTALSDVSITFQPGEIHAVLGENGAGKSTFMNILSGFLPPDEGEVLLDEKHLPVGRPHLCRGLGIEMVHQHFMLVPAFTVAENLALAKLEKLGRPLNLSEITEPALEMARDLGWEIDPKARISGLPVGVQQRIEILKSLQNEAKVLILDEPTAVLSPDEVIDLFRVLRKLKESGRAIVLIAHKLAEVMSIADRVTVLRRGLYVASARIEETNPTQLAEWMVGEMAAAPARSPGSRDSGLEVSGLTVKGDRGETAINEVALEIQKGEILGIGGVDGNGQVELAETLVLVRRPESGRLLWQRIPLDAAAIRVSYIPQDRQEDGLALAMSITDNLLIEGHRRDDLHRGPALIPKSIRNWAEDLIRRFSIKVDTPRLPVSSLSGGNQQKVVVSRNLDVLPDLLVAVNPTRGLDVKATQYVHEQILTAKASGSAVALLSTDHDELAALADRTVYLSRGRILEGEGALALLGGAT